VNNAIIVEIPNPLQPWDFTVFSLATSHYVADIVGYFATPQATAVECMNTVAGSVVLTTGTTGFANAPACPAGHTMTATNCVSTSFDVFLSSVGGGTCAGRNTNAASQTLSATATCCRVPGR